MLIIYNETSGPTGPAGETGPTGDTGPAGETGPSFLHTPAYISAYSANGTTVAGGSNVPLTTVIEPSENIILDKVNNVLIPKISGIYSVLISLRAASGIASVVLMQDGMMYSGTTFNINGTNLNQSLTTIIEVEENKPVYLYVMSGPLNLPNGTNVSITMSLIKNETL